MELTKEQIEEIYNKFKEEDEQYYTYDSIPEKEKKQIKELYKEKDETNKKRT